MQRGWIIICIILGSFSMAHGQETWDLEKCIQTALENNLQVKQGELQKQQSELTLSGSKASRLPSLNGFASNNYNFGRTIDPFTNEFVTDMVSNSSIGLQARMDLFKGMQTHYTIQRDKFGLMAAEKGLEKVVNDIALSVATAYLNVLLAEELLKSAQGQFQSSQKQTERIEKLAEAGSVPKGNLLDIRAQLSMEEVNVINAENQVSMAYLNLKQLMLVPSDQEVRVSQPLVKMDGETELSTAGQIYQAALTRMPEIKRAELDLESQYKSLQMAKGRRMPTLSVSGSIGTGYSGARKEITGYSITGFDPIGATGTGDTVFAPSYTPETQVTPFSDQINDNFNQTLGASLSIPIFNNLQVNNNIKMAEIQVESARFEVENQKNQLYQAVQQAHADARAALKRYTATDNAWVASKESFSYAEKRYELGMLNTAEFIDNKNRLAKAESDKLQAKYDYIFKKKILDFYQGKSLIIE